MQSSVIHFPWIQTPSTCQCCTELIYLILHVFENSRSWWQILDFRKSWINKKATDRWKAARLVTKRTTEFVQHLTSGLRSECSNHSRSTLAGSSCNWLQRRIRDSTTHFHFSEMPPKIASPCGVQEGTEWTGFGTRRNDWVTMLQGPFFSLSAR